MHIFLNLKNYYVNIIVQDYSRVKGSLYALVRHFEKEQIGELLDIIAVAHPIVAKNVTVVPEFLDDGGSHNRIQYYGRYGIYYTKLLQ